MSSKDDSMQASTLYFPKPLHRWLKHRAVDEGTTLNSIVMALLEQARSDVERSAAA